MARHKRQAPAETPAMEEEPEEGVSALDLSAEDIAAEGEEADGEMVRDDDIVDIVDAGGETVEPAEESDGEEETTGIETDASEAGEDDKADDEKSEDDEADDEESEEDGEGEEGDAEEATPGDGLPLTSVVEAVLFAAREPLKAAQIARAAGKRTRHDAVRQAIDELNVQYLETSRSFEIAEISGRYQLMSRPEFADYIMRIYPKKELEEKDKTQRLTPAMLDTLAIIAYKQPVMRSEIDHIRGVSCANALRALIERGSVKEVGRRTDLVGKPAVFGTTERFLAEFGLGSLDELPMRHEFIEPGGPPPVELTVANDQASAEEEPAESTQDSEETRVEEADDVNAAQVDDANESVEESVEVDEESDEEKSGEEEKDDDIS